ncbi:proteasome assembly chaperone family protein [Candidatus Pacearchaeota archaeon]|nr:proteasome assembly chaperone family protein [Candidatus Pacearchaeota archaeon]
MLKYELFEKPKGVTVIGGFPGMGLVGTITTEFLLDHLNVKLIGRIISEKIPALVAVHSGKVVEPLGIFYDSKKKIVIAHAVTDVSTMEWELAETILAIAKDLEAKEVISLEGIGSNLASKSNAFYFSNDEKARKKFESIKIESLKNGIVVGITGFLLLRASKQKISCIFATTHSNLPDSRAAATIIEVLDKYLDLDIPYEPLLKKAENFEDKLKNIFEDSKKAETVKDKKTVEYLG